MTKPKYDYEPDFDLTCPILTAGAWASGTVCTEPCRGKDCAWYGGPICGRPGAGKEQDDD